MKVAQNGLGGAGGLGGWGGLGLTDRVIAVRWSFLHPAAAALPAVAGAAGSGAAANYVDINLTCFDMMV